MSKHVQAYQDNAVTTASGPQLTLMLYNGCIRFINQGIKALEEEVFSEKNINIQKAQDIIQELMLTLNREVELSNQIMPLYDYIHHQLLQGNIKNDKDLLIEARELVTEFRNTWREAILKAAPEKKTEGARV